MKITVIGASGKAGNLIMTEAINRGHTVTAVVRSKSALTDPAAKTIEKDLFALTYADVEDSDVIIDAFGAWTPETLPLHQTSLQYLCDLLSNKPNRLLVVGGAGSLYIDASHTTRVMDTPDFPDVFKPLASNMGKALDALRSRSDVRWTYLSPAGDFKADGIKSDRYITGGEELTLNAKGESVISYADYAIAMVDEAENAAHIGVRFSVVGNY
ncbi:MAG: NAD(P)-dependent oxidoreductase [Oscillospiraceae bacterium]